jgi:hypothetical protein
MPLAQCMTRECMPPCYSLGITALGPLGESAYISPYLDPVRSSPTDISRSKPPGCTLSGLHADL